MTPSTLRAHLAFSFKAETYELEAVIDLERCLADSSEEPDFHQLLARASGIDPYSYLYEVLESYPPEFADPTGLAVAYCNEGRFDWYAFVERWSTEADLRVVRSVAGRFLGEHTLDGQPALEAALLAVYEAGKAAQSGSRP
jgi:hypothetical protein